MSLRTVAAALLLLATPTFAHANSFAEDDQIFGRWYFSVEAALAEQGITASSIEEWGNLVRVETRDEAGERLIVFVDKDTFRPIA